MGGGQAAMVGGGGQAWEEGFVDTSSQVGCLEDNLIEVFRFPG